MSEIVEVSATEVQKNFGRFQDVAQRTPVAVTSYGRAKVYILSSADYEEAMELLRSGAPRPMHPATMPQYLRDAVADARIDPSRAAPSDLD